MNDERPVDGAAAARRERFGRLPEPIRREDMTESKEATPGGAVIDAYDPERSWNHFSCLALDMGL
ncbi:hypothetical protein GTW93_07495 [Streptomyces sp. SID5789]|nr:hypothetical protein [Streptomyces sp. SID5789]MZE68817.1 hypothetical protein [Streptomyces sp. SID5789]